VILNIAIQTQIQFRDLVQNEIVPGLKEIVNLISLWAVPLAAIGSLSMALIEVAKNQTPLRNWFQRMRLLKWLRSSLQKEYEGSRITLYVRRLRSRYGGDKQSRRKQDDRVSYVERDLILLATSGDRAALYDLPIEGLCDQIRKVISVILDYPGRHPEFLRCLARGGDPQDIERIISAGQLEPAAPPNQSPEEQKQAYREFAAAKSRVLVQVRNSVDAIQTSIAFRWKFWLQWASMILSAILGFAAIQAGLTQNPAPANKSPIWGSILIGILAGFLAPIARDVLAAIQNWRNS